jgi:hypothetical protein
MKLTPNTDADIERAAFSDAHEGSLSPVDGDQIHCDNSEASGQNVIAP